MCVGYHYAQANTNNVNKTLALPQTTGVKDEPDIVFDQYRKTDNIGNTRHKDENKHNKNTTQCVLDTTIRKQTQIT